MLTQPPDLGTVTHVLARAEVVLGVEASETLADWLAVDWRYAAERCDVEGTGDQAIWAAVQQLVRASRLRADGHLGIANMVDHLAEACVLGWRQEMTVRTSSTDDVTG